MEPYTVALTSCGRFDLLERTLESLLPRLDGPLAGILIGEDSGNRRVYDVVRQFGDTYGNIDVILHDPPLGQIGNIDRLYSHIDAEWIFHCEDDWEFFADGFIEKSFAILKEFDRFSMVSLRDWSEFRSNYFCAEAAATSGVGYRAVNADVAGAWSGLSFNPGLRRMRDYRIVGPYGGFGVAAGEARVSECYRELGYRVAYLAEPAVRHIGEGRHLRDPTKPTGPVGRLGYSIRKRMQRAYRALNSEADPILNAKRRLEQAVVEDRPPEEHEPGPTRE